MKLLRLLLIVPVLLTAQNSALRRITVNDGLSQNYIFSILQDRTGFLWFGTKDGLNRYDGYTFTVYRRDNSDPHSLIDNTVTAIQQGEQNQLWIGTAAGGLLLFDQMTGSFIPVSPPLPPGKSLRDHQINIIRSTKDGSLLIGTAGWGLLIYHPVTKQWKEFRHDTSSVKSLHSNFITDVTEDRNGNIWVAADGLHIIDANENVIRIDRTTQEPSLQNVNKISALMCDTLGRIWVSYRNGLDVYTGREVRHVVSATAENNYYWFGKVAVDSRGFFYTTTIHHLLKLDPVTFELEEITSVPDERISGGFAIDRSDNVWVGTSGWGIFKYNPRTYRFGKHEGNFLTEVYALEYPQLEELRKTSSVFNLFDPVMRGNEFRIPFRSKRYGLFIPTTDAFIINIDNQNRSRSYPLVPETIPDRKAYSPQFIFEDRSGAVWIVRNSGLVKFDGKPTLYNYTPLYPDSIASANTAGYADISVVFVDHEGLLWAGTPTNGLLRYELSTGKKQWYRYRENDTTAISHNHILSIAADPNEPNRYLWIGTDGGGLNRMDRTDGTFHVINEKQGFPNNTVYAIQPDEEKYLWISTNKGLVKFNPRDESMRLFDMHDGLQSNEFNRRETYRMPDGKLYFGGVSGYNAFYPNDIRPNTSVPAVVLTDVRLFNRSLSFKNDTAWLRVPVEFADTLVFQYSDNVITFEFAGLEYSATAKNQYQYILEGFHEGWISNGISRTATFTNIDPGTYVFRVKASNGDGVWNESGKLLTVIILPPFWRTWWFITFLTLIFLATGPIIYYRRVTALKTEQRRQQEVSRLLIESQESERKRIAQEMHDSLGQELLVIKNRAVMGLKTAADESKEKRQLEQISEGATNILKMVRSISHNLRPPELDRLGLTETIRSLLTNVRESSGIALNAEVDEIDGLIKTENEINVIRILQESLSNIERHSSATEVTIRITVRGDQILMAVKDNGKGYSRESVTHGMGLAGISERVRILEGNLQVQTDTGAGTSITITIPIQQRI
jgi:signal transduction histidine kinase/ligand-binding sensor domain-containing protein